MNNLAPVAPTPKRVESFYKLLENTVLLFRRKRMLAFQQMFAVSARTRILDVGGTELNWGLLSARPQVTLLNLGVEERTEGRFHWKPGDARQLPFPDNSFDLCYSNSVIEHVGGREDWEKFASEIRRIAPAYYVQTPNYWFPVETHQVSLFLHWLPRPIERRLVRYFSVWGWARRETQENIDKWLAYNNLLTKRDMSRLFPDAEITVERFLLLPKSLIAVKRSASRPT
jgi:Methyltransferase domain